MDPAFRQTTVRDLIRQFDVPTQQPYRQQVRDPATREVNNRVQALRSNFERLATPEQIPQRSAARLTKSPANCAESCAKKTNTTYQAASSAPATATIRVVNDDDDSVSGHEPLLGSPRAGTSGVTSSPTRLFETGRSNAAQPTELSRTQMRQIKRLQDKVESFEKNIRELTTKFERLPSDGKHLKRAQDKVADLRAGMIRSFKHFYRDNSSWVPANGNHPELQKLDEALDRVLMLDQRTLQSKAPGWHGVGTLEELDKINDLREGDKPKEKLDNYASMDAPPDARARKAQALLNAFCEFNRNANFSSIMTLVREEFGNRPAVMDIVERLQTGQIDMRQAQAEIANLTSEQISPMQRAAISPILQNLVNANAAGESAMKVVNNFNTIGSPVLLVQYRNEKDIEPEDFIRSPIGRGKNVEFYNNNKPVIETLNAIALLSSRFQKELPALMESLSTKIEQWKAAGQPANEFPLLTRKELALLHFAAKTHYPVVRNLNTALQQLTVGPDKQPVVDFIAQLEVIAHRDFREGIVKHHFQNDTPGAILFHNGRRKDFIRGHDLDPFHKAQKRMTDTTASHVSVIASPKGTDPMSLDSWDNEISKGYVEPEEMYTTNAFQLLPDKMLNPRIADMLKTYLPITEDDRRNGILTFEDKVRALYQESALEVARNENGRFWPEDATNDPMKRIKSVMPGLTRGPGNRERVEVPRKEHYICSEHSLVCTLCTFDVCEEKIREIFRQQGYGIPSRERIFEPLVPARTDISKFHPGEMKNLVDKLMIQGKAEGIVRPQVLVEQVSSHRSN
jgi:hypothetical protein